MRVKINNHKIRVLVKTTVTSNLDTQLVKCSDNGITLRSRKLSAQLVGIYFEMNSAAAACGEMGGLEQPTAVYKTIQESFNEIR